MASLASATEAKDRHADALLARPHVCGVGTVRGDGDDEWLIEVHLDAGTAEQVALPGDLDGVPVRVVESGPFFAGPARRPVS